ncbi:MAG: 5-formyltetrahydrofolate cyclo-ligase [Desulfobacterales bacterium]
MEEIQKTKADIRKEIAAAIGRLSVDELAEKTSLIENRLFDFANFLESKIALMYIENPNEVKSADIIRRTFDQNKIVVLPLVKTDTKKFKLFKIDDFVKDLKSGQNGILQPDPGRCRTVPIDCIDIAIIPGVAFDEKGGRIGSGDGYYDRLIPHLPVTTRKVALALDYQIIPQVPIESHDKHVDIIITDKRIIYKI